MGITGRIQSRVERIQESYYRVTGRTELSEELARERQSRELLQESLLDLENSMLEPGWQRLTATAEREFSRDGLRMITAVCRVMALKNPLIKRGLALRQGYVWGQGVQLTGRDPKVNKLVQDTLDDPGNQRSFSGAVAREQLERSLGTDGNVFLALFTRPQTGLVQVRNLPWDEITDVISNPDDNSEPWYYERQWWSEKFDPARGIQGRTLEYAWYPAVDYKPLIKPKTMRTRTGQTAKVMWDAPVVHVKVGALSGWTYGIGDSYAALDWAAAYREFLTDWARLVKSLSRFAWRLTAKGSRQAAAKARLAAPPTLDPLTRDPNWSGGTVSMPPDMSLDPIPKSGATIDSESGRPLAAMVAAALDVPVTMLLGDPGTTGNRATAETLDTPTERAMELRRQVWSDAMQAIITHVVTESVRAPQGVLKGKIIRDGDGSRETVVLAGKAQPTVDISWPALSDVPVNVLVAAIVAADSTTHMPPLVTLRLLLQALGVDDVDEILAGVTDTAGNFIPPSGAGGAGQAIANAFRGGQDPVSAYTGPPEQGNAAPNELPAAA